MVPKWFPDSGLKWIQNYNQTSVELANPNGRYGTDAIEKELIEWHGLKEPLINVLFFGRGYKSIQPISIHSNLETVIEHFEEVLKIIQINPNY